MITECWSTIFECFNNSFVVGLCSTHIVLTFSVLYIAQTFYKGLLTLDKVICLLENLKDKLATTKVNQQREVATVPREKSNYIWQSNCAIKSNMRFLNDLMI